MINKDSTSYILIKRRIQLYNLKARNTGKFDFFGKDEKREKIVEMERQKLYEILRQEYKIENPDDYLLKPGCKDENTIKDFD